MRLAANLSAVTVVNNSVDASTWVGDDALGSEADNASCDGGWGAETLKSNEVGSEASNVGGCHAGSGDGVGGRRRADPGRQDVDTRGENVEDGAVVGPAGADILTVGRADGDGVWCGGGRVVGGVRAVIASGHDDGHASANGGGHSGVEGGRVRASERHGEDRLICDALALGVVGDPLDAGDDARVGAGAGSVKNLDGDEVDLARDTVGGAADGTGAVGAVSVLVSVGRAGDKVRAPGGTAAELL